MEILSTFFAALETWGWPFCPVGFLLCVYLFRVITKPARTIQRLVWLLIGALIVTAAFILLANLPGRSDVGASDLTDQFMYKASRLGFSWFASLGLGLATAAVVMLLAVGFVDLARVRTWWGVKEVVQERAAATEATGKAQRFSAEEIMILNNALDGLEVALRRSIVVTDEAVIFRRAELPAALGSLREKLGVLFKPGTGWLSVVLFDPQTGSAAPSASDASR